MSLSDDTANFGKFKRVQDNFARWQGYVHFKPQQGGWRKKVCWRCRDDELYPFAEMALRKLTVALPGTISKFLVRVNVMTMSDGKLVVN